jgi:hypothetical protein
MAATEILATIFAVVVLVKLSILLTNPKLWMSMAGALLRHNVLTMLIYLGLAAIVGYYVLLSLNIIEVAAVMLFTSLLLGLSLVPYSTAIINLPEEVLSIGVGKAWLAMLIWGALAIWVLYAVFA